MAEQSPDFLSPLRDKFTSEDATNAAQDAKDSAQDADLEAKSKLWQEAKANVDKLVQMVEDLRQSRVDDNAIIETQKTIIEQMNSRLAKLEQTPNPPAPGAPPAPNTPATSEPTPTDGTPADAASPTIPPSEPPPHDEQPPVVVAPIADNSFQFWAGDTVYTGGFGQPGTAAVCTFTKEQGFQTVDGAPDLIADDGPTQYERRESRVMRVDFLRQEPGLYDVQMSGDGLMQLTTMDRWGEAYGSIIVEMKSDTDPAKIGQNVPPAYAELGVGDTLVCVLVGENHWPEGRWQDIVLIPYSDTLLRANEDQQGIWTKGGEAFSLKWTGEQATITRQAKGQIVETHAYLENGQAIRGGMYNKDDGVPRCWGPTPYQDDLGPDGKPVMHRFQTELTRNADGTARLRVLEGPADGDLRVQWDVATGVLDWTMWEKIRVLFVLQRYHTNLRQPNTVESHVWDFVGFKVKRADALAVAA